MHHFGRIMGPKRKLTFAHRLSPEVKQTKVISQKCKRGKRMSPGKSERSLKDSPEYDPQAGVSEITFTESDYSGPDFSVIELHKSVIKGYHAYKIRPPFTKQPTRLIVDREYTNIKDLNACLVWIPSLDQFPQNVHEMVTDTKRFIKLSDIADLPIGHVPRSLAGLFRSVLDEGGEIFAEATGEPVPSFPPWPAPNEEGGGVVLPASYFIYAKQNIKMVSSQLKNLLNALKEGSGMMVVLK
ncbi:uncharacterized protein LOC128202810 [Mya arenaria]|uniref:uncharacterized protein LOC128202810 n=1 Tax=Mya arenaria TaxID=6604 RepID=UPI0022E0D72F|nr:uncharacterized protein LOC128202810 [Mya arenaria]